MFTYDLQSPDALTKTRSQVRLLIPDRVAAAPLFQDDELDGFLAIEGGNLKCATALALETISSDEALVQKVMKTQLIETDGAKTAGVLLRRAEELRSQAAKDAQAVADADDDGSGYFEVAEMVLDPFSYRERLWNEALRHG